MTDLTYPDFSIMKENFLFLQKRKNKMNDYERNADVSKTLTEQWKKGELPEGYYYIKDGENMIAEYLDGYFYNDGQPMTSFSGGVDEVLDKVPSYEEWQASENYIDYLKQCISVYESKEKQHTDDAIAYNELAKENEELKEIFERHKKATAKAQIRSCDLEIINAQLKERNDSLNNRDINLCRIANGIRDENFALKELLRECKYELRGCYTDIGWEDQSLINKIDEVLK